VRYDVERVDLADVTVPPYDVIDADARQALAARHPASAVVIDLPVGAQDATTAAGAASDDDAVYLEANATLQRWLAEGVLQREDVPAFYIYRMSFTDPDGHPRHTTGVFGALELSRPPEGHILPHEFTTPKAKSDRLNLTRATHANLSAVWGLSATPGLTALLEVDDAPVATWSDEAGVEHTLWVVVDPDRLAAISALADASPVVIADGHHRYETALTYRDEQRQAGDRSTPGAEAVLLYLVELADDELTVLPIHRLITGLPADLDLRTALGAWFEIGSPVDHLDADVADRVAADGALVLVTPEAAWPMVPRGDRFEGVRDLDTSRLDAALADLPDHDLVFQHGVDHVVERVGTGEAQAGVLLRPATVEQIVAIAHGGERMPPKTTFFHPKPRTGVVVRLLDE